MDTKGTSNAPERWHGLASCMAGLLACAAALTASHAAATTSTAPASGAASRSTPGPAASVARLTGDWGGARTALEDAGLRLDFYANDTSGYKRHGAVDRRRTGRNSMTWDLLASFDFEKMKLIPGGEALIHAREEYGLNINPSVRALSDPIDDADVDKSIYIDQLWYQQNWLKRKVQLRFGLLDYQTIIDRNAYANSEDTQFMSTFLDNNNATLPLPIGLGACLFINPTDWLSLIIGTADRDARIFRAKRGKNTSRNRLINEKHPMRVMVTLTDDCRGVFVKKFSDRFVVQELQGGTSKATFDYKVICKRRGKEDLRLEKFVKAGRGSIEPPEENLSRPTEGLGDPNDGATQDPTYGAPHTVVPIPPEQEPEEQPAPTLEHIKPPRGQRQPAIRGETGETGKPAKKLAAPAPVSAETKPGNAPSDAT